MACSHYPRELGIDICDLFDVEFTGKTHHAGNDEKQWFNIHYNKSDKSPKLLIHTRQLSMNITDSLLKEISDVVKVFCSDNNIDLM